MLSLNLTGRIILFSSILVSNLALFIKTIFAFGLTTFLANNLSNDEFATWSILLSLSLFFTLSDLGAGQYMLRKFVEFRKNNHNDNIESLIGSALVLFAVIASAFFLLFVLLIQILEVVPTVPSVVLFIFLGFTVARSIFIPFLALLSAYELFHYRKLIEAGTYAVTFLAVFILYHLNANLNIILAAYSLIFFICGLIPIYICKRLKEINLKRISINSSRYIEIVKSSIPYFINNLSLLVTRGGLVFLASIVLADQEVAQLAVLFTLFYQLFFQLFEIIIRTLQPKMLSQQGTYIIAIKFFYIILFVFVLISLLIGYHITQKIYTNIIFSELALQCFIIAGALEVIFTLLNARWQMFVKYNSLTIQMSALKAILYLMYVFWLKFFFSNVTILDFVLGLLFINFFVVLLSLTKQYLLEIGF